MDFELRKNLPRARNDGGLEAFVQALRDNPMMWGRLPVKQSRAQAKLYVERIECGASVWFPVEDFQVRLVDGVVWVRYVPRE